MSTTSQIFERVREDVLGEDKIFSVEIEDSRGSASPYEVPVFNGNPFEHDFKRLVPREADQVMDLDRFIEVAGELIEDAQIRAGVVEEQQVQLVSDYPEDDFSRFGDEVITWKLIERCPARMDSKGTGRPMHGSFSFGEYESPDLPNRAVTVFARPIDNTVEFICYSKNADIASRRAVWLERLFIAHAWVFKAQGVVTFNWKGRGIDTYRTTGGQKVYERPQRFFVRLVEPTVKANFMIRHIKFSVSAPTTSEK